MVFSMGGFKAPSLDQFPSTFFQDGSEIIQYNIIHVAKYFVRTSCILKELNHIFIILIPKVVDPVHLEVYRTISLYNIIYKNLSKLVVN